ncbi:MAG: hypothetical protein AAGL17_17830 [Cyanobacteria bacterium J06576_12]
MEASIRISPLSRKQFTTPVDQIIDFRVPKGCYTLNILVGRRAGDPPTKSDSEFCFDESAQLTLTPSQESNHPCDEAFCAEDEYLSTYTAVLNEVAIELQSFVAAAPSEFIQLGIISKSEDVYTNNYKVYWREQETGRVPMYQLDIESEGRELSMYGVHAGLPGNYFEICTERSLIEILRSGDEIELD